MSPKRSIFAVLDKHKLYNLLNIFFYGKNSWSRSSEYGTMQGMPPVCSSMPVQCAKEVNDRGYHFAYMEQPEACIGCQSCALVCPDACIEVYRVTEK